MSPSRLKQVRHDFPAPLLPGRLLRRYKRFLADIELDQGGQVTAHCPNSGSMLGCLADHAPVYVSHHPSPSRRTAHTWEMIHINGDWVGVNTGLPNQLAAKAAQLRALPIFKGARQVQSEVRINPHTRLDLLVQRAQGPLYIEVKNVTLVENHTAIFPDSVTARGAKHLQELMALHAQGLDTAMLYIIQRSDADSFAPAQAIDPVYAALLAQALAQGVTAIAVQARVTPQSIWLERTLPVRVG